MSTASIEETKDTTQEKDDVLEEKPALEYTERIHYDKETLMKLKSAPASQDRPLALSEEFLIDDGTWDPEAWHSSEASRTASPMVDQKIPDGKRKEQMDDGIELAPHRRSFRQGCHAPSAMTYDVSEKSDKHNSRSMFDKKNRLTGRASGQRKNMESNYREHGESNAGNAGNYERDYEKTKCDRYEKEGRYNEKEGRYNEKDGRYNEKDGRYNEKDGRYNEKDGRYNEKDGRYNEKDGRYNEKDGRYNEKDGRYNEKDGRNNEKDGRNNEKDGRNNEKEARNNEKEARYNEKEARYNEKEARYNEKEARYNEKEGRYNEKEGRYNEKEGRKNRYADKENRQPNRDEMYSDKEKYHKSADQHKEGDRVNRPNERGSKEKRQLLLKNRHQHGREDREENLPEWVTNGPTSQLDTVELTGFQDIEEEKKAYAKSKKKVRMSPDVEDQVRKCANKMYDIPSRPDTSRKSTPLSSKTASKEDVNTEVIDDEKPVKENTTKSPNNFDITEFFSEVNFYPPNKFHEDVTSGNGIRSRFTQYFQTKGGRVGSLTPDGGPLLPEDVFLGVQRKSPGVPTPYFTPIQPAPSPVPMVSPVASSFVNFIPEQAVESKKPEIKGRLNVEELEASEKNDGCMETCEEEQSQQDGLNQSAFDLLVQSMKDAGQLPDKPCPVVTGLPDHLLPQPPKKSSPTFEKLKRSLSRSPSPKEFMKAVSTVASILVSNPVIEQSEIALKKNSIQLTQPIPVRPVSPDLIEEEEYINGVSTPTVNKPSNEDEEGAGDQSLNTSLGNSTTPQVQRLPTAFLPTSVLKKMHSEKQRESPTAVQQPHTPDKSPLVNGHDSPFSDLLVNSVRSPKPSPRESRHLSDHTLSAFDNLSLAGQLNLSNLDCDDTLFHNSAPPTPRHSMNTNNHAVALPPHSNSAPNTPEHKFRTEPPPIQHVNIQPPGLSLQQNSHFTKTSQPLMVPSAFHAPVTVKHNKTSDFGAIGSGIRAKGMRENENHELINHNHQNSLDEIDRLRGVADPRLAPGNGVIRNTNTRNVHSPDNNAIPTLSNHSIRGQMQSSCLSQNQSQPSQQQQLLQAQRMAQIHQAQLHQQQKLQQIANQAKLMQQQKQQSNLQGKQFSAPSGVRPLLPDPENNSHQQQQKRSGEQQIYQQQQRQQIQAYHQQRQQLQQQQQMSQQQQQQQQQQQPRTSSSFPANNGFRNSRNFPNQNPEMNRTSPPMPVPLNQPGLQAFQNLNRPQGLQNINLTAQALVQQQLLNQAARARFIAQTQLLQQQPQVVQALMAQAALVRGQAQAQAAMMFNQKNIQAMAEQMGIRHQLPHMNNKNIPTPMINNQLNQPSSNSTLPNASSSDGLSKWFGKDILNLLPQNNIPPTELTTGKVLSVEELERKQRSS